MKSRFFLAALAAFAALAVAPVRAVSTTSLYVQDGLLASRDGIENAGRGDSRVKPYLVHLTDLFHPHADPDDHFDLAVVFALHKRGYFELARVILDYRPEESVWIHDGGYPPGQRPGDPALLAIAQLNEIFGCDVRGCVAPSDPEAQARMIVRILREADRPVIFTVVGTTEHIAGAIRLEPGLFAKKCAGIYLAAGLAVEQPGAALEYNVALHPAAFATTLTAPCPVYWAPCFQTIVPGGGRNGRDRGGEYGSVYAIRQGELLDFLGPAMQNYFLYMFSRSADPQYLQYLKKPVDVQSLEKVRGGRRRLWSTPLFLQAAGIRCESFEFLPVDVRCSDDGHSTWTPASESDHYIFHIRNCDRQTEDTFDCTGSYKEEMVARTKSLLADFDGLPK